MKERNKLPQDPSEYTLWFIAGSFLTLNGIVGLFEILKYLIGENENLMLVTKILTALAIIGSIFCFYQFRKKFKESMDSSNSQH